MVHHWAGNVIVYLFIFLRKKKEKYKCLKKWTGDISSVADLLSTLYIFWYGISRYTKKKQNKNYEKKIIWNENNLKRKLSLTNATNK